MKAADFDYELPPEAIAQHPAAARDGSRLLVLPAVGAALHRRFDDIVEHLRPGDLLILNDTRVRRARLVGRKPGGGRVELLLIERVADEGGPEVWRCLLQASRKPAPGARLEFGAGLAAEVAGRDAEGWLVRFDPVAGGVEQSLEHLGQVPLPPYIRRGVGGPDAIDEERYQTVYAREPGAVAAPTAGLHFTPVLLERLAQRGIERATLTLHVGPGTFLPLRTERVEEHRMHAERFALPRATAAAIERTRRLGGRIVAVGTTVVRVLESRADASGNVAPGEGRTDLFVVPPFRFAVTDVLLTNFHLPRSTLLMLVSAFGGTERVLDAYRDAVSRGYRFYSYGDAMLLEGAAR